MQCPRCQHENRPQAKFCEECAAPLSPRDLKTEVALRHALTEALEHQTATADILRVISSSLTDTKPVFEAIVASATRLCNGVFAAIYRMDGELVHLAGTYNIPVELVERLRCGFPNDPGGREPAQP